MKTAPSICLSVSASLSVSLCGSLSLFLSLGASGPQIPDCHLWHPHQQDEPSLWKLPVDNREWEKRKHWGGTSWEQDQALFSESEFLGLSPASVIFRLCDLGQVTWCLWTSLCEMRLCLLSWRTVSRVRLVWLVSRRVPTPARLPYLLGYSWPLFFFFF